LTHHFNFNSITEYLIVSYLLWRPR